MVTVGFEQQRGLRQKNHAPGGYQVSVSKTVAVPIATLYKAWENEVVRERWLADDPIAIRRATPDKSMRMTWSADDSSVDANFYDRGGTKSQVTIQHSKMADAEDVARMRDYWRHSLSRLKEILES